MLFKACLLKWSLERGEHGCSEEELGNKELRDGKSTRSFCINPDVKWLGPGQVYEGGVIGKNCWVGFR